MLQIHTLQPMSGSAEWSQLEGIKWKGREENSKRPLEKSKKESPLQQHSVFKDYRLQLSQNYAGDQEQMQREQRSTAWKVIEKQGLQHLWTAVYHTGMSRTAPAEIFLQYSRQEQQTFLSFDVQGQDPEDPGPIPYILALGGPDIAQNQDRESIFFFKIIFMQQHFATLEMLREPMWYSG